MDSYVNLKELLNNVKHNAPYIYSILAPIELITPPVDAVKVVRCKECKNWTTEHGGFCRFFGLTASGSSFFGPNGYCSQGEHIDTAKNEAQT